MDSLRGFWYPLSSGMSLLTISQLRKSYPSPDGQTRVIVDVPQFDLPEGKQVALRGESGSGKTTFLHLISGILAPDSGTVRIGARTWRP